jgi:hypothetical protein
MSDHSKVNSLEGNQIDASQSGYDQTNQKLKEINESFYQTSIIEPKDKIWGKKVDEDQAVKGKTFWDFDIDLSEVPENEDQKTIRQPKALLEKKLGKRIN